MGNLFRYDSKFFEILGKVTDIVILNLLFLSSCIPIITIGASVTSMYSVTIQMIKDEEKYIIKEFINKFKENFKVSTKVWLLAMFLGIVLVFDFQITNLISSEALSRALQFIFIMVSVVFVFALSYIFPMISKFDNTIKNTVINSVLISIQNLPYTILIALVNLLPLILLYFVSSFGGYIIFFYTIIGFALASYINSIFLDKILNRYVP